MEDKQLRKFVEDLAGIALGSCLSISVLLALGADTRGALGSAALVAVVALIWDITKDIRARL